MNLYRYGIIHDLYLIGSSRSPYHKCALFSTSKRVTSRPRNSCIDLLLLLVFLLHTSSRSLLQKISSICMVSISMYRSKSESSNEYKPTTNLSSCPTSSPFQSELQFNFRDGIHGFNIFISPYKPC